MLCGNKFSPIEIIWQFTMKFVQVVTETLGFFVIFAGRLETGRTTVIVRSLKFQPDIRLPTFVYSGISLNVTQQFELKHSYASTFRLEGPLTLGPGLLLILNFNTVIFRFLRFNSWFPPRYLKDLCTKLNLNIT